MTFPIDFSWHRKETIDVLYCTRSESLLTILAIEDRFSNFLSFLVLFVTFIYIHVSYDFKEARLFIKKFIRKSISAYLPILFT